MSSPESFTSMDSLIATLAGVAGVTLIGLLLDERRRRNKGTETPTSKEEKRD